jgi:hypothetical protein
MGTHSTYWRNARPCGRVRQCGRSRGSRKAQKSERKSGISERFCEGDTDMHEAGLAGSGSGPGTESTITTSPGRATAGGSAPGRQPCAGSCHGCPVSRRHY